MEDHGYGTSESHGVPVYYPVHANTKFYCLVAEEMCVNNLPKVALDSAAAEIEPAISRSRFSCKRYLLTVS